jgi:hypothetical protein
MDEKAYQKRFWMWFGIILLSGIPMLYCFGKLYFIDSVTNNLPPNNPNLNYPAIHNSLSNERWYYWIGVILSAALIFGVNVFAAKDLKKLRGKPDPLGIRDEND